jgi:hypothetical protein
MRHSSHVIERLAIGERNLPLFHGSLVVVVRDDATVDWEVVARTRDLEPVAAARHPLTLRVLDGVAADGHIGRRTLCGGAIFVRAVGRTLVFRGDGALVGFEPGQRPG